MGTSRTWNEVPKANREETRGNNKDSYSDLKKRGTCPCTMGVIYWEAQNQTRNQTTPVLNL